MKNWLHLPLAALVAALVGFASARFASPERAARGADLDGDGANLARALEELRQEQGALAKRLAELPTPAAPATRRAPALDLDAAIAAYMAKTIGTPTDDELVAGSGNPEDAAIADRILSGQVDRDEIEELWQKLREEDRIDGVLAEIERQVAESPNNPDLQSELGKAYIQKLFDVGAGPLAAVWGEKADQAFDRALALEDTHWEARFQKAMALSNWPEFMGKRGESLRQFETLMAQQEEAPGEDHHAWTYFFLGNLYDQGGEPAKATETWKRGAARFPGNEQLARKLEGR